MQIKRLSDHDTDRYAFDFGLCRANSGWAQIDTSQDASYFGIWAHPGKLAIVTFCEGDITICEAESDQEFAAEIRTMKACYEGGGLQFHGIDPLCIPATIERFEALGLGDLLH